MKKLFADCAAKHTQAMSIITSILLLLTLAGTEMSLARPFNDWAAAGGDIDVTLTFLISVNDTWQDCIATVKTLPIRSNTPLNKTDRIQVGNCDSGPLEFYVTKDSKNSYVHLTFHSSVIEDASPPTCTITWNYAFLTPDREGSMSSLLPGCVTADSREGYHMTYYWFYVYSW